MQANTDLIISGAVLRGKGNSIDVSLDRILRGEQDGPEIRVWLKTADYCRPEPELFPAGSQWVMALHRITRSVPGGFNPHTPNVSYGRIDDCSLSRCGAYWISLSGQ